MLKRAHSIVLDTILAHLTTLFSSSDARRGMATRQTSSSGKPKSPRIQVVLPEDLCERLAALAEQESRTVSNMAKVLIQQGLQRMEQGLAQPPVPQAAAPAPPSQPLAPPMSSAAPAQPRNADQIRAELESQPPRRLRGAPRRLRLYRP